MDRKQTPMDDDRLSALVGMTEEIGQLDVADAPTSNDSPASTVQRSPWPWLAMAAAAAGIVLLLRLLAPVPHPHVECALLHIPDTTRSGHGPEVRRIDRIAVSLNRDAVAMIALLAWDSTAQELRWMWHPATNGRFTHTLQEEVDLNVTLDVTHDPPVAQWIAVGSATPETLRALEGRAHEVLRCLDDATRHAPLDDTLVGRSLESCAPSLHFDVAAFTVR